MGRGTTFSPSVSKSSPAGPQARTYSPSTKPWGDVPPRPRLAHAAARYSRFARRPLRQREETRPFALRRRLPSQIGAPATPYALESTLSKPPGSRSAPRLPGTGPQEGTRRHRNCRPGQPPLARGFRPVPTYLKRRRAGRFSAVALQGLPPGTATAGHNDALQWTDWGKSLCAHLRRTSGQWQSALAAAQPIRGDLPGGGGREVEVGWGVRRVRLQARDFLSVCWTIRKSRDQAPGPGLAFEWLKVFRKSLFTKTGGQSAGI